MSTSSSKKCGVHELLISLLYMVAIHGRLTTPLLLLWIFYVFSVFRLLCLCAHLFKCALWSPTGKGLTSWLSSVVSICEFVTFPLVSWVRWGT